ncbi:SdrD B-like domain-containing protein [Leucobacter luti]|uniref:SdrD B-like domain-containing protein n=1 Tax=Leucobacter luti TaxID=340320 RepID=UPI001F548144|nr:SdrD B-like domain-containing protein [Leucobacter luti]
MKKFFSGVAAATLVLMLALVDVAGGVGSLPAAVAADTPSITLNGTVAEGDPGYLNSKSIVLSTGTETKVNYRLVPGYASGAATGVRVTVFLPSLEYANGGYQVVGRDRAPTPLGVQGRVSAGGGWNVISDTTVQGGPIVMEYDGDLRAGVNPAFDIFLTTYNDGTDGPYGGVPEGTRFEVNGSVSYEMFNRVDGSSWTTPNGLDDESRVSVISSDLRWETEIDSYVPGGGPDLVPIWDRYQYVDYQYSLSNTSDNIAANIDGYSVTFDIDSTDSDVNGIIPFDINRWKYAEGGPATPNEDRNDTSGQFVGVPGEGGVLIYDVTDWDGASELTDEIPYTYSGTGMLTIDREHGANRQEITPAGAAGATERKFLISLPLSRQGFPNPPTNFRVTAITNILFAKTANWSKTRIAEREIVLPEYGFSFTHVPEQREVVYGYETFTEISELRSGANAPTFDARVRYEVDPDFAPTRVSYELPEAELERFERAGVSYSFVDERTGETVSRSVQGAPPEVNAETGMATLTFDLSELAGLDWDRTLAFGLADRVEAYEALPVSIRVFGEPSRVGEMTGTATAVFVEKIASNDDFGDDTTYTEVPHETPLDATFTVIYPEEVVPSIAVSIDGAGDRATVAYGAETLLDFVFGVNGTTAATSTTTLTLNAKAEALKRAELTLRAALFAQAENVRVRIVTLDGDEETVDLAAYSGSGDFVVALPERAAQIVIDTDALTSDGAVNFASVAATVGHGLDTKHLVTGEIRTYQPKPYDRDTTRETTGTLEIRLPNELVPAVDVVGVYGSTKTKTTTNVGYESTFAAEYQLDTRGVTSPSSEYVIDMLAPTKSGALAFSKLTLQQAYLDGATAPSITFVDAAGVEQRFTETEVTAADVTLRNIDRIVVAGTDLSLAALSTIAIVEYRADIEIGSSQALRATFTGTQETPYVDSKSATKQNQIQVRETKTQVKVEGVNQVTQPLGAGSAYSVDIYRWWNRGSTYNTQDYTLDQGYKSLGGFTSTLTRPTASSENNDQRVSVDVALPHEQFDLYYVKIREDVRPYLDSVDLFRMVDGKEELWKTIPGDAWVENSQEGSGYWRIGTARPGTPDSELFTSYDSVAGVSDHPYYKDAWDADVRPASPVSRVAVNLEFTRESTDAAPQMAGVHDDVIEYMGRFHSSSVTGKRATTLTATDTFGTRTELTRSDSARINSLVAYPFAQSRTGANDSTSLANKVIPMGSTGEYLASIFNVNTANWSYYSGHGPDVYSPAATEYDEWLGMYDPASFHDALVYEFVYPASPDDSAVYNLDATHVTIAPTSTLQYLTAVRVTGPRGDIVSLDLAAPLGDTARFDYDNSVARGIHDDGDGSFTVSFGAGGGHPKRFEAVFEEIAGFGERTAEIDGVAPDTLGASLAEVDVRVGGVVNGNTALQGTTNLYRVPADTQQRTLMHTSSATLTGYTPKLGAKLDLSFDRVKVYDYLADGITPSTTQVAAGIENSSEADIKDVVVTLTPDPAFRSQLIAIPDDIFAGDWSVAEVAVSQGGAKHLIPLADFTLNRDTGAREFDLRTLFDDGTLRSQPFDVALGGAATLHKQHVDGITVSFAPRDETIGLWGSLTRANSDLPLPTRMRDGGDVFVTGTWVDEDADGSNWNSKPSFVTERSKGSTEQIMYHSAFTASAAVTSYNPIFVSAGTGNAGAKPTLTLASSASSDRAPRLFTRVARMQALAVHMQHDSTRADATVLFYDADTGTQINYTNIAVGDTAKVLYELRNVGATGSDDAGPGSLPVFTPVAHIEAPANLEVSAVTAASAELLADGNRAALIGESPSAAVDVPADAVEITRLNGKRSDVRFDLTLGDGESVFFMVEYTATNDVSADPGATQGKTLQWNVYARPGYAHHFMSYNSDGVAGNRVTGATAAVNLDGDGIVEQLGRLSNTAYRYADPNQLVIESRFDSENVSGQAMTLTVKNIRNEILHDNTALDLFVTLDAGGLGGFELTGFPEVPTPTLPDGSTGRATPPRVHFQDASGAWVAAADFDPELHALREIGKLWIEYGVVPALGAGGATFEAPAFTIPGIGHWKTAGAQTTKSYRIASQAQTRLTHRDDSDRDVATYSFRTEAAQTAYKAIPSVEFNIQSFDTRAEAEAPYDGAALGKTGYRAGDEVHYRLTAKNHTTAQGTSTTTPNGKAPLRTPVVVDKIPEYLSTELNGFVRGGTLDVAAAIEAGALELRVLGADGTPRDITLPTVTVETVAGLDVAGAQTFANDRRNDGWGRLATAEPVNTTVNPADTIAFQVFTYTFTGEDLGRGEQLEIIYSAQAREQGLPVARYADGSAVFAPFFGWYGSNVPVASTAQQHSMDMAALLHDAGITGDRGHEMTATEFLSNSFSWQPGANDRRRDASNSPASYTQATFYDASANTQKSHTAYLRETATNDLYTTFAATALDENFGYAAKARVNDGAVRAAERIMWAQDGMQLNRAWLYGASEMVPDTERAAWGTDPANFIEHDGSLNSYNRHRLGYTPYVEDDYSYAVQLHEEFTVRLHAANLGDRAIESGLEYTEILPPGISPTAASGELLGVTAVNAAGAELASTTEILQTPEDDRGYRAPAQSQEAGTFAESTRDDMIPYVIRVRVAGAVTGMFGSAAATSGAAPGTAAADAQAQTVHVRVRVADEVPPAADGLSTWHDELTLTSIAAEEYLEIYGAQYGAFSRDIGIYNTARFPNDGMPQGLAVTDLAYDFGSYSSYFAVEPWGTYIRGLNAQATETTAADGRPALVTGDQIAMRTPTLRVWSAAAKDTYPDGIDPTIEDFSVDLYEEFTLRSTVENQQLEVLGEYNRVNSGYNRYSGENFNDDIWKNAPQTIGGARGTWFEPTVTISLPYGVAPVLADGSFARYTADLDDVQQLDFTATVNTLALGAATPARDVSELFDARVELLEDPLGKRFVLHFTARDDRAADIASGESLVVAPRVVTIDTPLYGADTDDARYQDVLTFANTSRPVFNPVVSEQYTTGSTPSLSARDQGVSAAPNNVKSSNGLAITANDRVRRDSTSTWSANMGALKITERLIEPTQRYTDDTAIRLNAGVGWTEPAAVFTPSGLPSRHEKTGAYGSTALNLKKPSITNETTAANTAEAAGSELIQVDAAGKYWYVTEVTNEPVQEANPYETLKTAGDVHNARFVVTQFVTNFAEATGEVRIRVGDEVLDRAAFEALGYSVERLTPSLTAADESRSRVQWLVTTPAGERGTRGELKSGDSFTMLYEVQLVDGYEDNVVSDETVWTADELIVDSYVSLIADDTSLIPSGSADAQRAEDFIVQSLASMKYHTHASDVGSGIDIDGDGELASRYAADSAEIEILKPRGEVRVNTTRPRIAYSNGLSGDTYFNSSDTIEYLVTHAQNTGSALTELVIENILPTDTTNESTVSVSNQPITASTRYVSSGAWALPADTTERLAASGTELDAAFKTFVYVSDERAEDGYEGGGWRLLNPGGTSLRDNERFEIPQAEQRGMQKIRVIVRALMPERFLVPQGARLDIDADPDTDGAQSVLETDPSNRSTTPYPAGVTDNAISIGVRIASNAKSTLFVYDTAQFWGNYVAARVSKLAQSETRSYLTPSRPVVNVKYNSLYYRSDSTKPADQRFGWSDITAIAPKSSPHLKFTGEFINADESMWSREEDNTYAEDTLVNPFVTFQLPAVMESGDFSYVPRDEIDAAHPLDSAHRSRYSLTAADSNLWTWKLVHADGSEASLDSELKHTRIYSGPWSGFDRNVVSIWFEGSVAPGDKIVVEFIGSVDAYSPGADPDELKSRAMITNNTGLLHPLNSQQNAANRLGYATDSSDFNDNRLLNDRLVFSEKSLFQYETYDNFGKRKVAYSDLNRAGTVAPELTPVRQGGDFSFEVSVDNSKEAGERAYPYPILYDVLPSLDDTSITNSSIARGSQYSAWLNPDGMKLVRDGADKKTYGASEYTVFVGPFTKQGGEIVEADMVPHAEAASESFYDSLGIPGAASAVRDRHFVPLAELQGSNPELLRKARSILVLFNSASEQLPGQNKLTFTYTMKSPLNAPAYLEQFDAQERKGESSLWNSFMATQRVSRFIPQESNNAGVYATEKRDRVYLGNYVWNDVNYNGEQDEGEPAVDGNGRTHLQPSRDLDFDGEIDDPGINGVTATLLTPRGYNVDALGNPIHEVGDGWEVVDEASGESVLDEVFLRPIASEGPLVTVTESDIAGNDGYYTFSNIAPGDYRVLLEFPREYDAFSTTTETVFEETGVRSYGPGEVLDIPAAVDTAALVAITDPARVDAQTSDAQRMSFDLGIAQMIEFGGTVFSEDIATLDGYQAGPNEPGIPGYHVTLKRLNGETVLDPSGAPMVAVTDAQGNYSFTLLPVDRQYTVEVTDETGGFNPERLVSPFLHHTDPFAEASDNDGFTEKGTRIVKTNPLNFDLEGLHTTAFAPRDSVSIGFYDRSTHGVIGNRVWDDRNRNGLQDADEPGIAGQQLALEQYLRVDGEWQRTDYTQTATSNDDGYYYFTRVPSTVYDGSDAIETRYQVVVTELVTGYTFAPTHSRGPSPTGSQELDSDLFPNGTMHESDAVGEHLISVVEIDDETGVAFGVTDNTIDLGLLAHARSALAGEVFIDTDGDGIRNDAETAEPVYTATLEVRTSAGWVDAKRDAAGRMIEPAAATADDETIQLAGVNSYRFEELHIIDSAALVPYEYRVRVDEVPLWQAVTALGAGDDPTVDSDFTAAARGATLTAVSESRILGELQEQLLPIDTAAGVPAEHVDLGLVPLPRTATIGDLLWDDRDRDGVQGPGEPGLADVRVVLNRVVDGELVPVAETHTDAAGAYEFTADVAETDPASARFTRPHTYVAEFELSSRQSLAPFRAGGGDGTDSRFEPLVAGGAARYAHAIADPAHTAVSEEFALVAADATGRADYASAANTAEIDGGVVTHDTVRVLGDTLYDDRDANGAQGSDEPGIPGIEVALYALNRDTGLWEPRADTAGNATVVTGASGDYEFAVEVADLDKQSPHYRQPIEYRVLALAPANLRLVEVDNVFFHRSKGDVAGIKIDRPLSSVLTEAITLVDVDSDGVVLDSARDVRTADAGFTVFDTSVAIGGRVWEDANLDGIQDSGEPGIAGRTVELWERIDEAWVRIDDLTGVGSVETTETGEYRFEVAPTHYEEGEARFLAPREYRVTAVREGYQEWSPLNVGDDRTRDSDISPLAAADGGAPHTGATPVFAIADHDGEVVDMATARDDLHTDIGLRTSPHLSELGGTVWDDANEDGARQAREGALADREVTLWERVAGEWRIAEDATGAATQRTAADGSYAFSVLPTEYDAAAAGYLLPREYRVTIEVPRGYRLSAGSTTATLAERRAVSQEAQLTELDEAGQVVVSAVRDDRTLGFPFARVPGTVDPIAGIPIIGDLALTGSGFTLGYAGLVALLLGIGAAAFGVRRQRAKTEGERN